MALVEIQLNRLGINSLEIGATEAEVSAGAVLHVRFINYGAPTHITIKADTTASQFTLFTYENIYLEAESEISVPVKLSAPSGSFGMTVISGYGLHKENITVNVIKMPDPEPLPMPSLEPMEPSLSAAKKKRKAPSSAARTARRVLLTAILPIVALAIILLWIFLYPSLDAKMIVAVTYVIMLAGIAIAWVSAR